MPPQVEKRSRAALENKGFFDSGYPAPDAVTCPVTQGMTHGVTHHASPGHQEPDSPVTPERAKTRRSRQKRRPAPYLQLRGRAWYFRKRLSQRLADFCGRNFFVISLRTHLASDATLRAARLLVAMDKFEATMTHLTTVSTLSPDQAHAILREFLRKELSDLLSRYDSGRLFEEDPVVADVRLDSEEGALKSAARQRDFSAIAPDMVMDAQAAGVTLPEVLPTTLGLQVSALKRDILGVERRSFDLEDPRALSAPMVSRFTEQDVPAFVAPVVTISMAIARTRELHPSKDMQGNINALATLLFYHFGADASILTMTKAKQEEFFTWAGRLPTNHGRSHGKNRYNQTEVERDKNDLIAEADACDAEKVARIRDLPLSLPEKRALLTQELIPRLTERTLKRYRDGIARMFRAAEDIDARDLPKVLTYRDIERIVKKAETSDDALHMRMTKSKIRTPWSAERMAKFLQSPLYTGQASEHRRWKRGRLITRDALYWVPLFWLALGTRHEEIVLAKRSALVVRNGVCGLWFGEPADLPGKTASADRFLPIPQVLLDLGFVEWVHSLRDDHGPLLFPDAARRSVVGKSAENLSKALRRILEKLGIKDFDEDFYAMRKTFLSMLSPNIEDGMREAIAGHRSKTILNRHYTAHEAQAIKEAVDGADFRLEIAYSPRHGFPIIKACNMAPEAELDVSLTLAEDYSVQRLELRPLNQPRPIYVFDLADLPADAGARKEMIRTKVRSARRILDENSAAAPKHPGKRRAFESFLAQA